VSNGRYGLDATVVTSNRQFELVIARHIRVVTVTLRIVRCRDSGVGRRGQDNQYRATKGSTQAGEEFSCHFPFVLEDFRKLPGHVRLSPPSPPLLPRGEESRSLAFRERGWGRG